MGIIKDSALGAKSYVESGISNAVNGTLATVREGVASTIMGVSKWTLKSMYNVLCMGARNIPIPMPKLGK